MHRRFLVGLAGLAVSALSLPGCSDKNATNDDAGFGSFTGGDAEASTGAETASATGDGGTQTTGADTTDSADTSAGDGDADTSAGDGDGDGGDGDGSADTGEAGLTCDACWMMHCSAERADCEADTDCDCVLTCVDGGSSAGQCKNQCGVQGNPPLWSAWTACTADSCFAVC